MFDINPFHVFLMFMLWGIFIFMLLYAMLNGDNANPWPVFLIFCFAVIVTVANAVEWSDLKHRNLPASISEVPP
jgi:energy-coupling factor transporter transmembrane protein EcfT